MIALRRQKLGQAVKRFSMAGLYVENLAISNFRLGDPARLVTLESAVEYGGHAPRIQFPAEVLAVRGADDDVFYKPVFRAKRILVGFIAAQEIVGGETTADGVPDAVSMQDKARRQ